MLCGYFTKTLFYWYVSEVHDDYFSGREFVHVNNTSQLFFHFLIQPPPTLGPLSFVQYLVPYFLLGIVYFAYLYFEFLM